MTGKNKDHGFIPGTILFFVLFLVFAFSYSGNPAGSAQHPGNHKETPSSQTGFNTADIAILPAPDGTGFSGNCASPANPKPEIKTFETIFKAADFDRSVIRIFTSLSGEIFKMTPAEVWRQSFMLASLHSDQLPA